MTTEKITTERLFLIPFTRSVAMDVLEGNCTELHNLGIHIADGWPDDDVMETLPKIINNLQLSGYPTGFESWMIIKQDDMCIIGDVGFKGIPNAQGEIDLGYGIIRQQRKKGYAFEAAKNLVDRAFSDPKVVTITARSLISNADSAKILTKINFTEWSRSHDMIHWILDRERFYAL
ncbi:GNAT family N-acetyltransferase [Flavobacterium sp. UBA4197]|uniref:GNAT family N-acetyltransferase n=1 Tax=Flavobacterium sp. UBA4197 TaxID=1946546 RepID=UPI00257F5685|nr:GNAT family N-acetyltransferase [Flavobacterium sp. UBA4197]